MNALFLLLLADSPFTVGARPDGQVEQRKEEPDLVGVSRPRARRASWIVGVKIAGQYGAAGPIGSGTFGAIEVGYRLPVLHRTLGLSLEPAFGISWRTLTGLPATAAFLSVPLFGTANLSLGDGLLRVALGPSFEWFGIKAGDPVVASSTGTGLGLSTFLGYGLAAGPGLFEVSVRYRLSPAAFDGAPMLAHSLALAIGYNFLL